MAKNTAVTEFNLKRGMEEFGIEEYHVDEYGRVFAITENGLVFRGMFTIPVTQTSDRSGQSVQTPKSFC